MEQQELGKRLNERSTQRKTELASQNPRKAGHGGACLSHEMEGREPWKLTVREPGLCAANASDQRLRLLSDVNRHAMAHVSGSILPPQRHCLSLTSPLPPHTHAHGKEAENLQRHVIREGTGMGDDYMKKGSASPPVRK